MAIDLRQKKNTGFKLLLPLLMFLVFLTIIMIGGFIFYQNQKKQVYNEARNQLSVIARLKADQIVQWRKEKIDNAGILSNNPALAKEAKEFLDNSNNNSARENLLHLFKFLVENHKYHSIVLFDAKGKPRLAYPASDSAIGPGVIENFHTAMSSGKTLLTDLHKSANRQVHLDLLTPLVFPAGNGSAPIGLILMRVDPNNLLFPLISTWPVSSKTAETLLVRFDKDTVVYLNDLRHRNNSALNFHLPVSDTALPSSMAARGIEGTVLGKDYRKVPVLATIYRIPDSPWVMIAKIDLDEINSPLHRQMIAIVAFVGILIAFAASLIWIWRRSLLLNSLKEKIESEISKLVLDIGTIGLSL